MNSPIKVINHVGFISDLKAAHKGFGRLKLRARNKNRKQFYSKGPSQRRGYDGTLWKHKFQQDLPTKFATHFAFYGNKTVLTAVANVYKAAGINIFHNV